MSMIPNIQWLNNNAKGFFVIDFDSFSLYNLEPVKNDFSARDVQLISSCSVSLTGSKQEHDSVRCAALDYSPDNYLALGYFGRISISKAEIDSSTKFFRGEEIREIQRNIAFLNWSFHDNNKLCVAYDPLRGGRDHTVVVYDLNRTSKNARDSSSVVFEANLTNERVYGISWFREDPNLIVISSNKCIRIADIREHGNFQQKMEGPSSQLGVVTEPTLGYRFACHSRNNISVFDRRFLTANAMPIHEISSVCPVPRTISKLSWHPNRLFHISCIAKDSGNFYHLPISANAYELGLGDDKSVLKSFDSAKQAIDAMADEFKYATLHHSVPGFNKLTSFDWHPVRSDSLAVLGAPAGRMPSSSTTNIRNIRVIQLRNDVNCAMSCNSDVAVSEGPTLTLASRRLTKNLVPPESKEILPIYSKLAPVFNQPDQVEIFKARITNGYGYGNTLNPLSTLIENSRKAIEMDEYANDDLKFCWRWAAMMFQSGDLNEMQKSYSTNFPGIKHIVKGAKTAATIRTDDVTFRNRIFVNDKRLKILKLCDWPLYMDREECKLKLDELMNQGNVQAMARAAALAMFSVQGSLSKEYLTRLNEFTRSRDFTDGHAPEFVIVYQNMAITVLRVVQSYDGLRIPDYEAVCGELAANDYLLAIVKFLARRERIYNTIFNEIMDLRHIELGDKLAFAAIHMDDELLEKALDKLLEDLELESPLSALLITGLDDHHECHSVLHRYLELSRDLQTTSILLAMGNCFRKSKVLQDLSLVGVKIAELLARAVDAEPYGSARRLSLHCFRDYVEMMNTWRFWVSKTFLASFLRVKVTPNEVETRARVMNVQAVIACTFCGSPIYPTISEKIESLRAVSTTPKMTNPLQRQRQSMAHRSRMMSCLCRKPLPKCAICRRHFGSQVEVETQSGDGTSAEPSSAIDHWFVWCCSCNHGGHLAHIRDWFSEYEICPTSGCDCQCMSRDNQLRDELYANKPTQRQTPASMENAAIHERLVKSNATTILSS